MAFPVFVPFFEGGGIGSYFKDGEERPFDFDYGRLGGEADNFIDQAVPFSLEGFRQLIRDPQTGKVAVMLKAMGRHSITCTIVLDQVLQDALARLSPISYNDDIAAIRNAHMGDATGIKLVELARQELQVLGPLGEDRVVTEVVLADTSLVLVSDSRRRPAHLFKPVTPHEAIIWALLTLDRILIHPEGMEDVGGGNWGCEFRTAQHQGEGIFG